jgi:hypothetical protein
METNALPRYDMNDNPTGCCPRFNPEGWDGQDLHFESKPFLKATTRSAMHVPLNMGKVFARVQAHIEAAEAFDPEDYIVLSHDVSAWQGEHFFSVSRPVADEEMTELSGHYITKVFEGPYAEAKRWHDQMQALVRDKGGLPGTVYFFYTTCPRCAKAYGKNYVVGVARM